MNYSQSTASESDSEINLIDLMIVVAKRKKLVIGVPIACALIAAAISSMLPNTYMASAKLLPPQQGQSGAAAALLSQLGGMAGAAAGVAGIKNPNDLYVGMLKSRTVADKLITRFDLKKAYKTESQEKARKILDTNTVISNGKDGLITISVEGEEKSTVAPLTNGYVSELINLSRVLAVTEASQRRMFYEHELERSKNNLAQAEVTLKRSLDVNGVISVDSDSRAMVETIGRLRAQISAKEIQLRSMEAFVTATNPEYLRAREELNSLRVELSRLENGRAIVPGAAPQPEAQRAGLQNIKVLRDVKYHQMLYELLAKQYEVARLEEAKEPSVVQVLDPAVEPERKSGPKRMIIVFLTGVIALFATIFAVLVLETKQRALTRPGFANQWEELRTNLRFGRK